MFYVEDGATAITRGHSLLGKLSRNVLEQCSLDEELLRIIKSIVPLKRAAPTLQTIQGGTTMNTLRFAFLTVFLIAAVSGCKKDTPAPNEPPPTEETPQTATQTFTSASGGSFSTPSGYGVTVVRGSVPQNANGQTGSVTFSIETNVTPPKPLPSGATLKGNVVKFGPDGFNFQWPVRNTLKIPANTNPSQLSVLFYDAMNERWVAVPGSGANSTDRVMSADMLSLGYVALAELSPTAKQTAGSAFGGFEYTNPVTGKYYTLTVATVSNYVYPWQETWFGGQIVGRTGSTGTSLAGGPDIKTYILLPQASYEIWVSETDGSGVFFTYSLPLSGRITQEVIYGTTPGGSGWTPIGPLPAGGTWVSGLPTSWPRPTVTYGTGVFQATLTWVNNSSHATDLDLHLYGPNNMHVYYGARVSPDSSFQLDRDWLRTLGNAVENTFSTRSSVPAGSYRVTVKHYSGDATNYSVRILRGGSVRTYHGSASANTENEIASFTLP
jgi:hypothetical protein